MIAVLTLLLLCTTYFVVVVVVVCAYVVQEVFLQTLCVLCSLKRSPPLFIHL